MTDVISAPGGRRLGRPRLNGLAWLVWRQHRMPFWIMLGLVAVASCAGLIGFPFAQGKLTTRIISHSQVLTQTADFQLVLPALVGMFIGVPLIARELESATTKLVWSQSVGRRRWLAYKLGFSMATIVLVIGFRSSVFTWMWLKLSAYSLTYRTGPHSAWHQTLTSWTYEPTFLNLMPVMTALAVLGLAVGTTAALLLRRTYPAMLVSAAVMTAADFALYGLRMHLVPVRTAVMSPATGWDAPGDSLVIAHGDLSGAGEKLTSQCAPVKWCLAHGLPHKWSDYVPRSELWLLQAIEAGLCLAVAAALLAVCFWLIRRRPA